MDSVKAFFYFLIIFHCCLKPVECASSKAKVTKPWKVIEGKCSTYKNTNKSAINSHLRENYVAMRWDYKRLGEYWGLKNRDDVKRKLAKCRVKIIHYPKGKYRPIETYALIGDYGPHPRTGRVIDLCPKVAKRLNLETDDVVMAMLIEPLPPPPTF